MNIFTLIVSTASFCAYGLRCSYSSLQAVVGSVSLKLQRSDPENLASLAHSFKLACYKMASSSWLIVSSLSRLLLFVC